MPLLHSNPRGGKFMNLKQAALLSAIMLILGSGFAASQTGGCRSDMSVIECVRRVADIAQGFNDKVTAFYSEITRRELPVGSVVTSVLPPEIFLSSKNPQFDASRWVPADGRALPANSIYKQMTDAAYAPDLR